MLAAAVAPRAGLKPGSTWLAEPPRGLGAPPIFRRAAAAKPRRLRCRAQAEEQVAIAVPTPDPLLQPQPQPGAPALSPWALVGGLAAVAAGAVTAAFAFRSRDKAATSSAAAAAVLGKAAAAPAATAGAVEAAASEQVTQAESSTEAATSTQQAAKTLPLTVEAAGPADDVAQLSLAELQKLASELYLLIQQMEVQMLDMVGELSVGLSADDQLKLEVLSGQFEELEELMPALKAKGSPETLVRQVEQVYEQLHWQQYDLVTAGASDAQRRSYRSLLLNLSTQRQLLRRVERNESVQLREAEAAAEADRQRAAAEARAAAVEQRAVERAERAKQAEALRQQQDDMKRRMQEMEQQMAALAVAEQQQMAVSPRATSSGPSGTSFGVVGSNSSAGGAAVATPSPQAPGIGAHPGAPVPAGGMMVTPTATPVPSATVPQLRLVAAGVSMPHPKKVSSGGEDAFFVSNLGQGAIGVADGVGGWAAEGINPALYPRRLMAACEEALQAHGQWPPLVNGAARAAAESAAVHVLEDAYEHTIEPGSCATILALLLPGGWLSVANHGDCGLKVLRNGRIVYASQILEHTWNMPYQLSCPDFYDCGSRPADGEQEVLEVQAGDVVVMGSDGLFDNLWDDQLVEAVRKEQGASARSPQDLAQQLARRLASTAHKQSTDPAFVSPFAVERHERMASEMHVLVEAQGGKQDDVTVVVAVIE